jgi:hypothetical protein
MCLDNDDSYYRHLEQVAIEARERAARAVAARTKRRREESAMIPMPDFRVKKEERVGVEAR